MRTHYEEWALGQVLSTYPDEMPYQEILDILANTEKLDAHNTAFEEDDDTQQIMTCEQYEEHYEESLVVFIEEFKESVERSFPVFGFDHIKNLLEAKLAEGVEKEMQTGGDNYWAGYCRAISEILEDIPNAR